MNFPTKIALVILTILVFFTDCTKAQSNVSISGLNTVLKSDKKLTLDTVELKITYNVEYLKDPNNTDNRSTGRTLLLVGKKSALYIDYYKALKDSVREKTLSDGGSAITAVNEAIKVKGERFSEIIVQDYPHKGSALIQDFIGGNTKRYIDNGAVQEWFILDDTTTIAGFTCRKAVCNYRGREWTAWFTNEIPITRGPYLFKGLPGLIMKLTCENNEYDFTLIGIEKVNNPYPLQIIDNKNIEKISREDFIFLRKYYNENPALSVTSGIIKMNLNPEQQKELEKRLDYPHPFNPIEKE